MPFDPQNITGVVVTWTPTGELRWTGKTMKKARLQQKWFNVSTKATEWRDVAFVHYNEDD